ncbi:MAG TPA: molybdopterin dehydrogenase [Kosmotogaceae bacterium]|nr:MAG: Aerobic-type carbon monoxide dehydrogenase, middle subunit CoxM/CutM-like protein [Thermotogales bacterium 46_20]HAA84939.1 molybdopterin dehydrogenase [Kosmotogaceae bacterium]
MLPNVKEFIRPETVQEAYALLEKNRKATVLLAGGTIVSQMRSSNIETIVDLRKTGLDKIVQKPDEIAAGAMVTAEQFRQDRLIADRYGDFFYDSFGLIGNWQLRNMITLGGSIAPRLGWSDITTCLMTVGASLLVYGQDDYQTLCIGDYFQIPSSERPIITHIILPDEDWRYAFYRFARSAFDIATLNMGIAMKLNDRRIVSSRIVCGSRPMFPARMESVEESLVDLNFDEQTPGIVRSLVYDNFSGGSNMIASSEYRNHLASVLAERAVKKIGEIIL